MLVKKIFKYKMVMRLSKISLILPSGKQFEEQFFWWIYRIMMNMTNEKSSKPLDSIWEQYLSLLLALLLMLISCFQAHKFVD